MKYNVLISLLLCSSLLQASGPLLYDEPVYCIPGQSPEEERLYEVIGDGPDDGCMYATIDDFFGLPQTSGDQITPATSGYGSREDILDDDRTYEEPTINNVQARPGFLKRVRNWFSRARVQPAQQKASVIVGINPREVQSLLESLAVITQNYNALMSEVNALRYAQNTRTQMYREKFENLGVSVALAQEIENAIKGPLAVETLSHDLARYPTHAQELKNIGELYVDDIALVVDSSTKSSVALIAQGNKKVAELLPSQIKLLFDALIFKSPEWILPKINEKSDEHTKLFRKTLLMMISSEMESPLRSLMDALCSYNPVFQGAAKAVLQGKSIALDPVTEEFVHQYQQTMQREMGSRPSSKKLIDAYNSIAASACLNQIEAALQHITPDNKEQLQKLHHEENSKLVFLEQQANQKCLSSIQKKQFDQIRKKLDLLTV